MAKVNFILSNKVNSGGEALILLNYRYSGGRLYYSTGQVLEPKHWNVTKHQARKTYRGYAELNQLLSKLSEKVEKIERQTINESKALTIETFKEGLNNYLRPKPQNEKQSGIINRLDEFIKVQSNLKRANTIKKYNTLSIHLQSYRATTKTKLEFSIINYTFYESFCSYLIGQGLNNTSVGKYISALKTFLRWSMEKGYCNEFDLRKFKVTQSESEVIALTMNELTTLYNLDLSTNKRLDQIRDLFIFSCSTGARYGDTQNLSLENITEDSIHFTTIKTSELLYVPLNFFSRSILAKYNNQLPRLSNQKANLYLKELLEKAKLSRSVKRTSFYGAKRKDIVKSLYEAVTFHSGRKTFITLYLLSGGNREEAKKLTGLKNYSTMERYIKVDLTEASKRMNEIFTPILKAV